MHEETIKQWDRDNAGEPQIAPEGIECPKHVAIVGLGLIGGSLARRLRESGCHVSAWNHRDHPYANARAAGIDCKDTYRLSAIDLRLSVCWLFGFQKCIGVDYPSHYQGTGRGRE